MKDGNTGEVIRGKNEKDIHSVLKDILLLTLSHLEIAYEANNPTMVTAIGELLKVLFDEIKIL